MPPGLERYVEAQQEVYEGALAELRRGRKESHWMWFVFPQMVGLGTSTMASYYAIRTLAEAAAYLHHPVLGARLVECCQALLDLKQDRSAAEIFGSPDDLKLRSCLTLFSQVPGSNPIFTRVLNRYYAGEPDHRTLGLLGAMGKSEDNHR